MALKIIWTPQAIKGLDTVLNYLDKNWTEKEIFNLEKNIIKLVSEISKYPTICSSTNKFKNLYKGLVEKTTT